MLQNKIVCTCSVSSIAKARNASHRCLASSLWDVQRWETGRDTLARNLTSYACLFPLKTWSTKISCVHTPEGSKPTVCQIFSLPSPLTFLQSLRNAGSQFGTPSSAVSLRCMFFMLFKIQALVMGFFAGILHWSFTFRWAQVHASASLFCVMRTLLDFQSPPVRPCVTPEKQDHSWPLPHSLG